MHAARIEILVTELNVVDWKPGGWPPDRNTLGQSIALTEAIGAHLAHPRVVQTHIWSTRWVSAERPAVWETIDERSMLLPTGQAVVL